MITSHFHLIAVLLTSHPLFFFLPPSFPLLSFLLLSSLFFFQFLSCFFCSSINLICNTRFCRHTNCISRPRGVSSLTSPFIQIISAFSFNAVLLSKQKISPRDDCCRVPCNPRNHSINNECLGHNTGSFPHLLHVWLKSVKLYLFFL